MEFVFKLLSEQSVIAALQLLVGGWAKKQVWFANKFIPVLTWLAAVIGFTLAPASAQAAGWLGGTLPAVGNVFLMAAMQNLLVTGTHSTWKNFLAPTFWDGIRLLAAKVEQKAVTKKMED